MSQQPVFSGKTFRQLTIYIYIYLKKDWFDKEEIKKYLSIFQVQLIDKRETIRFSHKKNYYVFIAKKQL